MRKKPYENKVSWKITRKNIEIIGNKVKISPEWSPNNTKTMGAENKVEILRK